MKYIKCKVDSNTTGIVITNKDKPLLLISVYTDKNKVTFDYYRKIRYCTFVQILKKCRLINLLYHSCNTTVEEVFHYRPPKFSDVVIHCVTSENLTLVEKSTSNIRKYYCRLSPVKGIFKLRMKSPYTVAKLRALYKSRKNARRLSDGITTIFCARTGKENRDWVLKD